MLFTYFSVILSLLSMSYSVHGAPTASQLLPGQLSNVANIIGSIVAAVSSNGAIGDACKQILAQLEQVRPTTTPTSVPQATSLVNSVFSANPTANLYAGAAKFIANGITPGDLGQVITTLTNGCNSGLNFNLPARQSIYPQKASSDAPYSVLEAQLLAAIHIPSTFTYGKIPPVILTPGTGSTGCLTYTGSFIKTLTGTAFADPVWLNIPDFLLDDAQANAEYVAYAINYISSVSSNKNVSVIAWSQGNLDTQWALKYWPSTRSVVSDFISISADFHGTQLAFLACPGLPSSSCTPSVIQQEYGSAFVGRLRSNGGDSAYVPTTSVYSGADEVVQPQTGVGASAYMNDARGIGVSNTQIQVACPGAPAGGPYTHEAMLYNPLAFALAVDALTHPGPGNLSRIDLKSVCAQTLPPGLDINDVVSTEENIVVAAMAVLIHEPIVTVEPLLRSYATY